MLIHTTLYAKLHYERSGNIWSDIQKCIEADDYAPMDCNFQDAIDSEKFEVAAAMLEVCKNNIICILTNNVANLVKNDKIFLMNSFIEAIDKHTCWKYGYYHDEFWGKGNGPGEKLEKYDYKTAVLHFFLHTLAWTTIFELGYEADTFPKPNPNVLPVSKSMF